MGRSSRVDFSRGCKGRPGWVLDWFGWICHLCGVAGEVSGWGDGEAAIEGDLSELRLGLREVSGELGNSRRKEGGGSTGVEMCWWRKWKNKFSFNYQPTCDW